MEGLKQIFLSRPTWVADDFKKGLDGFLQVMKSHNLSPRTVGATDFPTKSPMDEVISLMQECVGAVILGYPQIKVETGSIKGLTQNPFQLATEWNHIEAGIAITLGLPLLIIHDETVIRGIFDKGAANQFLYSVNLLDISWPLQANISGAIEKWKGNLLYKPLCCL